MSASKLVNANNLAATFTTGVLALTEGDTDVTLGCLISDGSGGAPATATGSWTAEFSWDQVTWFPLDDTDVAAQLAKLNASGTTLVRRAAKLYGVPGTAARFTYTRAGGGGAGVVCDLWAETC